MTATYEQSGGFTAPVYYYISPTRGFLLYEGDRLIHSIVEPTQLLSLAANLILVANTILKEPSS